MIIDAIARQTRLTPRYLHSLAKTASHRYKTYSIPKRNGSRRIIHQPARELKLLQIWLVDNLFSLLPVHGKAFGYIKGRGILEHAALHRANNFLLRVDFSEFFPSITSRDVRVVLNKSSTVLAEPLSAEDLEFVSMIVCKDGRLTIGAPSSPTISNCVMYDFDRHSSSWSDRVTYSRYADDVFFSTNTPNLLSEILAALREDIRMMMSPRLTINESKLVFTSRKRKRLITGLVLSSVGAVSLGRARKRFIRGLIHRYSMGLLSTEERVYLQGFLAFARGVDCEFIKALEAKYGKGILASIH